MKSILISMACLLLLWTGSAEAQQLEPGARVLRPGDKVQLRISPDSTLSGEYPVEGNGAVYLPLLGAVDVAGQTTEQVRSLLVDRYSATLRDPVVVVSPRFRVSLLGSVGSPGLYFIDATTTLLDLISMAGGFAGDANQTKVHVGRIGGSFTVNVRDMLTGSEAAAEIPLHSGDRIVVPRRSGFRIQSLQIGLQMVAIVLSVINLTR